MWSRFTQRQKWIVGGAPALVLLLSWAVERWTGSSGALVAIVLLGAVLIALHVEGRYHALELFRRGVEEQRAIFGQVEAIIGLNQTLSPRYPLPATRGWAASPDLLREVVAHVLTEPVGMVVEGSSGTSTLVIAYALERKGSGRVVALEHDEQFAERTRKLLGLHGLTHRAVVVHAPLVKHRVGPTELLWYDLAQAGIDAPIDLLVVDGPPEGVAALARYPAVPILRDRFAASARVLLDDGARPDERIIAERWKTEFGAAECEFLYLEKGAWSLRFQGHRPV